MHFKFDFGLLVYEGCRPYFRSHFYMDQNHVRGMSKAHYGAQAESSNHQGAPKAEMKFVSIDRERKTLVEKKMDLSKMNQDPAFDNFHLIQFLYGYRSDMRRQFAILRHQSRANYRRKTSQHLDNNNTPYCPMATWSKCMILML